jgi:hypothetical protein
MVGGTDFSIVFEGGRGRSLFLGGGKEKRAIAF